MCLLQHMPMFQHTAARRRLGDFIRSSIAFSRSFNTQPPEGGWSISTLSATSSISFNTQPPEGGWDVIICSLSMMNMFQHTAARRRLDRRRQKIQRTNCFNTQPPEGGWLFPLFPAILLIRFNTQPPEGGWNGLHRFSAKLRCFNTQPPEGGWALMA